MRGFGVLGFRRMLPHMKKKKEKREGKRPARERPEERARQESEANSLGASTIH